MRLMQFRANSRRSMTCVAIRSFAELDYRAMTLWLVAVIGCWRLKEKKNEITINLWIRDFVILIKLF